jgi:hypothetical protein
MESTIIPPHPQNAVNISTTPSSGAAGKRVLAITVIGSSV